MAFDIQLENGISVAAQDLKWSFARSGGPGGQHVNTSDTKVTLSCHIEDIAGPPELLAVIKQHADSFLLRVTVSESRSQWQNRAIARDLLSKRLDALCTETPTRRPTRISASARRRRVEDKQRRSERKRLRRDDFDT